jgi:hypothetical protein
VIITRVNHAFVFGKEFNDEYDDEGDGSSAGSLKTIFKGSLCSSEDCSLKVFRNGSSS